MHLIINSFHESAIKFAVAAPVIVFYMLKLHLQKLFKKFNFSKAML